MMRCLKLAAAPSSPCGRESQRANSAPPPRSAPHGRERPHPAGLGWQHAQGGARGTRSVARVGLSHRGHRGHRAESEPEALGGPWPCPHPGPELRSTCVTRETQRLVPRIPGASFTASLLVARPR